MSIVSRLSQSQLVTQTVLSIRQADTPVQKRFLKQNRRGQSPPVLFLAITSSTIHWRTPGDQHFTARVNFILSILIILSKTRLPCPFATSRIWARPKLFTFRMIFG
jgi:hypothetical protein